MLLPLNISWTLEPYKIFLGLMYLSNILNRICWILKSNVTTEFPKKKNAINFAGLVRFREKALLVVGIKLHNPKL